MEENKNNNVKSTIDAVTGLANAIPVYQDAVQPAAKEIGKSLATVTKTVNIALAPIKALVWGYEKIEEYLTKRVSEKLEGIPEEDIVTPPPHIAGPAVEALRFTGENENLRELYASLLAMSMNKNTADKAHPSFVEIIKNLSTNEAIILKEFISSIAIPKIDVEEEHSNGVHVLKVPNFTMLYHNTNIDVNSIPVYLDNLQRLGIIETIKDRFFADNQVYEILKTDSALKNVLEAIADNKYKVIFRKGYFQLTSFGRDFVNNVVAMG